MENQIAKTQNQEISNVAAAREGFEVSCQMDDLIIPRAKLFNGLPKEYEDYPDAKPGQILNNITKETLPAVFIPIMRHIEWIRFNPASPKLADGKTDNPAFDHAFNPGEVIWRSTDPNDSRVLEQAQWGPNGEKPWALKFLSFLSYFPGSSMPVIVSFYKTSMNAGRTINSVLEYGKGAMYEHSFRLSTKIVKTGEHSHFAYQVSYAGRPSAENIESAKALYQSFRNKNVQAKQEFVD